VPDFEALALLWNAVKAGRKGERWPVENGSTWRGC
jgi:hypothetical protein